MMVSRPLLPFVVLVLLLVGTAAALAIVGRAAGVNFVWLGLAVVAIAAFMRPGLLPALAMAVAAGAVFAALVIRRSLQAAGPGLLGYLPDVLLIVGAFGAVAIVADRCARLIQHLANEVQYRERVIKELTRRDPQTNTLKRPYAERLLMTEVDRARRYGRPLSLVIAGVDDWARVVQERGQAEALRLLGELGEILTMNLRVMDIIGRYGEAQFLLILPETPLAGAQVVAERIIQQVERGLGLTLQAGVAEFPRDASAAETLLREAEAALTLASAVGIGIASRALLAR